MPNAPTFTSTLSVDRVVQSEPQGIYRQRTRTRVIAAVEALTTNAAGTSLAAIAERLGDVDYYAVSQMVRKLRREGVIGPAGKKGVSVRLADGHIAGDAKPVEAILRPAMTDDGSEGDVCDYAGTMLTFQRWCKRKGYDFRSTVATVCLRIMREGRAA